MTSVFFDAADDDSLRRQNLYDGDIFVYSPTRVTEQFCQFARQMIEDAFDPLDPLTAQFEMPVEDYAVLLGKLKPAFIHAPESKRFIQQILAERGCDARATYFDVPKMRTSTSDGYLTAGIAYAWHPHRDTWYSAPHCQINWWMPIYDIEADNCMSFHPRYFKEPVQNTSSGYNYYKWNEEHRGTHVTQYINEDPRPLPKPSEPVELEPDIRLVVPVGGMVLFSAAQLHASVPNQTGKTRFSMDFRSVHEQDLRQDQGAVNQDAACTGTVLRDFLNAADLGALDAELIARYDDQTAGSGLAVYQPDG